MIEPLNEAQQHWVATTFETLSTEAKVAQLLIPNLGSYDDDTEDVTPFLEAGTLGGEQTDQFSVTATSAVMCGWGS